MIRFTLGLAVALCLASSGARAAQRPSVVPPDGEHEGYLWTAALHTPAGNDESSAAVVLRGTQRGTMQVAVTVDGDDKVYLAKSLADGSLDFVATRHEEVVPQLERLDHLARIAGGASAAPKVGDTWKLEIEEPVPRGTIPVTLTARVTSLDGDTLRIEADGDATGSIELPQPAATPAPSGGAGGGPGFPSGAPRTLNSDVDDGTAKKDDTINVRLKVHIAASFADGRLVEAHGAQLASPTLNPKESVESDWAFTKS